MAKRILMERYLMANPRIRMLFEFSMIIVIGILGEIFSWKRFPFSPYSNILGGIILLLAWCFHEYCHKPHRQAHQRSEAIQEVVTQGVFSKIRHPMYLSLIVMEFGIAIAWGIVWMLIPVIVPSILTILTTDGFEGRTILAGKVWETVRRIYEKSSLENDSKSVLNTIDY